MIYSEKTKLSKWKLIPPLHKQILQLRGGRSFPPKVGPRLGFEGLSDPDFFFFDDLHGLEGCVLHVSGGGASVMPSIFFSENFSKQIGGEVFSWRSDEFPKICFCTR